ncbi:MAG TPA: superoxide dismutase [Bacteroidales bacterium]|jgi:Fe-Mn family superoxide dismutase|nr:superoxide dismutase [Bacteroidales bacterium]HPE40272.1 superoxide dismutase [Bacteroidales bacterium]
MKRINLLTNVLLVTILTMNIQTSDAQTKKTTMKQYNGQPVEHIFPNLPYAYAGLEPHMDALTVEIHYDRHHRNYYNQFMALISETPYKNASMEFIFSIVSELGNPIRNNGGGYFNHVMFWDALASKETGAPSAELLKAIEKAFGSVDGFFEQFNQKAMTQFGSGWAWLIVDETGNLQVTQTPNQDNPLMDVAQVKGTPIFNIDVWEHAYYLKYQNKRADFVKNYRNMINWNVLNERYAKAVK